MPQNFGGYLFSVLDLGVVADVDDLVGTCCTAHLKFLKRVICLLLKLVSHAPKSKSFLGVLRRLFRVNGPWRPNPTCSILLQLVPTSNIEKSSWICKGRSLL